jgi:peptidoglycan/LPS O-acetylase OafA/YrhL
MTLASTNSNSLPRHIPALDGVRGLAIGLVLLAHCLHLPLYGAVKPGNWQQYAYQWTNLAWSGVELFFVLSGFLITKVLLENQDSPGFFRTFYARRACRILPLYFAVVVVAFAGMHYLPHNAFWAQMFGGQFPWQSYATLTQNYAMGVSNKYGGDALAVTWSLAVEEQFYLVLPLVIRFFPRKYLPWLLAGGIPWAYLARMHFYLRGMSSYVYAPCQADALLLGCLLAWACHQPAAYAWLQKQGGGLNLLLLLLTAGLLFINRMPEFFGVPVIETWLAFFYGALVLLVVTQSPHPITRLLSGHWIGYLGTISYGVYLLHFGIQNLFYWVVCGSAAAVKTGPDLIYPMVIIGLSVAVASASWFLYERHWVKLGHRMKF